MKLTLDRIRQMIDLNKQLEKCIKCPCVNKETYEFIGCFNCDHWQKDCVDHNCDTGHINHKDTLALCSADDCALTRTALTMMAKKEGKYL